MFNMLKTVFMMTLVLTHWIPEALLVVGTDASDYALAAILLTWTEGELHPIAFHSCTFNSMERNYDVHDKELLAIFEAFKKWHNYLKGMPEPVDVVTDHKNLVYFATTKLLTHWQVW